VLDRPRAPDHLHIHSRRISSTRTAVEAGPAGSRNQLPTATGAIYPLRYKAIQFSCERRSRTGYKDRAGAANARRRSRGPVHTAGLRKSASIFNLAVRRVS
jgi:hypothetical protein